ncbi:uncharacterized protein si:ch211-63p21.1 isoform X2 [Engraulis encrasicolus]|uniref:uncharacterized protein si:ch211-63p21.1 isoform X2 n=1 Tax=Engraulis encrasicolus TaxID=184585 RepID=UPI002FD27F1B
MRRLDSDSNGLFSSGENSDCEDVMGATCVEGAAVCVCKRDSRPTYCDQHQQPEEGVQSDPQGESDADADIEDTDSRVQVSGSLQRISSRKRKRQRITRQDTTESEDDGGKCQKPHRWNLRLSPHHAQSKTILEESVSQVRPLVLSPRSGAEGHNTTKTVTTTSSSSSSGSTTHDDPSPKRGSRGSGWTLLESLWPSALSSSSSSTSSRGRLFLLLLLIFLPLALSFLILIVSFLLPLSNI